MKRVVLVLSCLVWVVISAGGEQNKKEKIRLEKVEERKLEKNVTDLVYAKSSEGKIYSNVIIGEESIDFVDEKGNIKKRKEINKLKGRGFITKSRNGKAFGVWEVLEIDEDKSYVTDSKFTLFNENGDVVWEKTGWQGEGGPSLEISDDGETVVVNHFTIGSGSLEFYNSKGLIKKFQPMDKRFYHGSAAFSGDGKL